MTINEFRALPSKTLYERGDRVLTWDRASRPVLPGVVWEETIRWDRCVVSVDRTSPIRSIDLPRWRVRLAPVDKPTVPAP